MNFTIRIFTILLVLLLCITITSCNDHNKSLNQNVHSENSKKKEVNENSENSDFGGIADVKLTLSRGAFHWDSFTLIGNELSYIPTNEMTVEEYPEYQKKSKKILSDSIVRSLIKELMDNNIFEFQDVYDNETSDNSKLEIELIVKEKRKKIICNDFERGCPEVLKNLEKKIILLHGKNLKRIMLPG